LLGAERNADIDVVNRSTNAIVARPRALVKARPRI
jgi:hypothetical protein